jgi:hypothetical protein
MPIWLHKEVDSKIKKLMSSPPGKCLIKNHGASTVREAERIKNILADPAHIADPNCLRPVCWMHQVWR